MLINHAIIQEYVMRCDSVTKAYDTVNTTCICMYVCTYIHIPCQWTHTYTGNNKCDMYAATY